MVVGKIIGEAGIASDDERPLVSSLAQQRHDRLPHRPGIADVDGRELDMADVRETVSIQDPWTNLTEEGDPRFPERLNAALGRQLTALAWWAYSLRAARHIEIRKGAPADGAKVKEPAP